MQGSTFNNPAESKFQVRAASDADVPGITVLLDASSQHWDHRPTSTESVVDRLAELGTSPAQDTVVVAEAGRLLAFGHTWPASPAEVRCFGRVHPDHQGQGIGTILVRELRNRAQRHGPSGLDAAGTVLTTATPSRDGSAPPLLRANGFREIRFVLQMVSTLDKPRPPHTLGNSITLREFAPGIDEDALFTAFTESFAEHWGHEQVNPKSWWFDLRDSADAGFDPSMWFLAFDRDDLVGFCLTRVSDDDEGRHGYVSQLGVRPPWRGRGLGYALLDRSLEAFEAQGLKRAKLDVDAANVTDALRVYRKAGMQDRPAYTIWTAPL